MIALEDDLEMTIALEDEQALEDDLELARVGYVVVLNEVAPSHRQNLAQGDVRPIFKAELLLEDDYVIRKDDFLQGDHVRSFSDPDLGCRKVHTQQRREAHENSVQTVAVHVHLDFLAVVHDRLPEVVLVCIRPIQVEMGCEELRLFLECQIPPSLENGCHHLASGNAILSTTNPKLLRCTFSLVWSTRAISNLLRNPAMAQIA